MRKFFVSSEKKNWSSTDCHVQVEMKWVWILLSLQFSWIVISILIILSLTWHYIKFSMSHFIHLKIRPFDSLTHSNTLKSCHYIKFFCPYMWYRLRGKIQILINDRVAWLSSEAISYTVGKSVKVVVTSKCSILKSLFSKFIPYTCFWNKRVVSIFTFLL